MSSVLICSFKKKNKNEQFVKDNALTKAKIAMSKSRSVGGMFWYDLKCIDNRKTYSKFDSNMLPCSKVKYMVKVFATD